MADKDGVGWAADAMLACRDRLEVATNNLANGSSRDFRAMVSRIIMTPTGLKAIHSLDDSAPVQRATGRQLDLAIDGHGSFRVMSPKSGQISETRVGAFSRDKDGYLVDSTNRRLVGENGPIRVDGVPVIRGDGSVLDHGRVVGKIVLEQGAQIRSGFLEWSNMDSAQVMLNVLDAQRSFETAEKALTAVDMARQKDSDEVGRLKQ